jgi:hypothetical protein
MKWKTFWQIIILVIFTAVAFYIAYPKYSYKPPFKINKITGRSYRFDADQQKWVEINTGKPLQGFLKLMPK